MTISSSSRKSGPYSCNGSTVQFPFDFKVFSQNDVLAVLTNASGTESNLALGADYSVSLNANQDSNPGGTITTTVTYATGYLVTLTSAVRNLQPVDLTNQGGFYPKVINTALDRLTVMVQQVAEQVGRAVKVGISSATSPDQLISQLLTAVANALGYANSAIASATAAAGSAAAAAQSASDAANSPIAAPTHSATSKATPVDADELPIADSAASYGLKKLTWVNLKAAVWAALGPLIMTGTGKATPVDADYLAIADSAAGNATKSLSWANLKATLKTYFDTLYQATGGSASVLGSFRNLQASATGLGANVSITADEIALEDGSNNYVTARAVNLTINTAAAGANGQDTGTLAASTWYSTWVIRKPDGTTAGLISLSATAPTMPSGYTFKARTGWIRTDGTGNKYPLAFVQKGRTVKYLVAAGSNVANLPIMISGTSGNPTTPTWTAVAVANFIPTTAAKIGLVLGANGSSTIAAPNNSYGAVSSTTNPPPLGLGSLTSLVSGDFAVESANIYYACAASGVMACSGWEDIL